MPPRSARIPWGVGYLLGRERGRLGCRAGSWPFSISLAASWTRHMWGDLRSSAEGDLGCRRRPQVWVRVSNVPARPRARGTDDTRCREPAGAAAGKESGRGRLRPCKGTGVPAEPREKHPGSEGAGGPGVPRCPGVPRKSRGELVYLRPLDFHPLTAELSGAEQVC